MSDALRRHLFITSVERAARLRFDGRFVAHSVHFVFPKTANVNTCRKELSRDLHVGQGGSMRPGRTCEQGRVEAEIADVRLAEHVIWKLKVKS